MALLCTWSPRILAEGGGPGGGAAERVFGASGVEGLVGLVGSRLLMRHLPGGGREQPPAQHVAEQAEELLTRRVRQLIPELIGVKPTLLPRRRRGGTGRLEGSDMAPPPGVFFGRAAPRRPVPQH